MAKSSAMSAAPHRFKAFSRKWAPMIAVISTAALLLLWNNAGPASVLVSGLEFVEGQTTVQAGPLEVVVNGRVSIEVTPSKTEPPPSAESLADLSRFGVPETLGGATVTVTVHRGSATVTDHAGEPVRLALDESKTFSP